LRGWHPVLSVEQNWIEQVDEGEGEGEPAR